MLHNRQDDTDKHAWGAKAARKAKICAATWATFRCAMVVAHHKHCSALLGRVCCVARSSCRFCNLFAAASFAASCTVCCRRKPCRLYAATAIYPATCQACGISIAGTVPRFAVTPRATDQLAAKETAGVRGTPKSAAYCVTIALACESWRS